MNKHIKQFLITEAKKLTVKPGNNWAINTLMTKYRECSEASGTDYTGLYKWLGVPVYMTPTGTYDISLKQAINYVSIDQAGVPTSKTYTAASLSDIIKGPACNSTFLSEIIENYV